MTSTDGDTGSAECPWCGKQMSMANMAADGCFDAGYEGECPHCGGEYEISEVEHIVTGTFVRRDRKAEEAMVGKRVAATFAGRELVGQVQTTRGGLFVVLGDDGKPWPFRPRLERVTVVGASWQCPETQELA